MADRDSKRFYWLKLNKDFFQQHKMKVLKALPNGRLYALIYMELLAESTSHEGGLRFSEMIPYDTITLAAVIDEDKDNLEKAIEALEGLEMVEILEDQTIYMREIKTMVGSETGKARRMREYRKNKQVPQICSSEQESSLEYRDKSIEYRDKNINNSRFTPPAYEEVNSYCKERNNNVDAQRFIDFYESKGWMVGKNKMKDWKACVRTWEQKDKLKQVEHTEEYKMDLGDCRGDYW